MPHESLAVTTDGVHLHVTETGTGEPLLFLHEFAGDERSWSRQVAALSGDYRCITYAARGYRGSDVPPDAASYSWQRAVADAVDVLDALGVDSVHVVGLSMGGFTAIQLGLLHPDRVRSITAVSVGTGSEPGDREAYVREAGAVAQRLLTDGPLSVGRSMAEGPTRIQLRRSDEVAWGDMVEQFAQQSAEGLAHTISRIQCRRPSFHDLVEQLRLMSVPLLVVDGDEDEACLATGLLLKRTVPRCGLLILPHTGHVPQLEDPERFSAIVRCFIARLKYGDWPIRDAASLGTLQFGMLKEVSSLKERA